MKIKVREATHAQLNWLVAECEPATFFDWQADPTNNEWSPTTNWAQGGPIIEWESVSVIRCDDEYGTDKRGFTTSKRIPVWGAITGRHHSSSTYSSQGDNWGYAYSLDEDSITRGPTPLVAAMRCYVASKLGDEVELPEELANGNPT